MAAYNVASAVTADIIAHERHATIAELRVLRGDPDQASLHVVFMHGLESEIDTTFQVTTHDIELWPCWLFDDVQTSPWGASVTMQYRARGPDTRYL